MEQCFGDSVNGDFVKSSISQLASDFGEYPLRDLTYNDGLLDFNFKVRSLSFFSKLEIYFISTWAIMFGRQDCFDNLAPDLKIIFPRSAFSTFLERFKYEVWGVVQDSHDLSASKKFIAKFILIFLIVVMFPLFFIFFIAHASLAILQLRNKVNSCIGMYYPFCANTIFIRSGISNERNLKNMIIAHEHIHFLQGELKTAPFINYSSFDKAFSEIVIPGLDDYDRLKYFCELKEVEARFHEFVVSFYKLNYYIPRDYQGFLRIIFSVKSFSDFICMVKDDFNNDLNFFEEFDNFEFNGQFLEFRNLGPASELIKLLSNFRSDELKIRFMSELLSVVYANLLGIYSGESDRLLFLASVPKIDLYNYLYFSQ